MTNTLTNQSIDSTQNQICEAIKLLESALHQTNSRDDACWWHTQFDNDINIGTCYLRDYRTITVAGGRQIGKTQWVIDNADKDTLVICINKNIANGINARINKNTDHRPDVMTVIDLINYLEKNPDKVKKYSRIILDEAQYIADRHGYSRMYKYLYRVSTRDTKIYMIG